MDTWTQHMRRGNFTAAWQEADAVLAQRAGVPCWHLPRHLQAVWDGTPLVGRRVLVRCYHGLGDTVQFIRFLPLLKRIAAETIVWAQPALLPLLRTAAGIDRLLPLHDGTPEVAYDVDVELMELPHILRTTLETLPAAIPYLHVEPAALPRPPGELAVGVVWQAGDWDARRSVPAEKIATLAKIPGVVLYALQRGPALRAWPREAGAVSGGDRIEEAAAVMRALDLLVTIDSLPAHLGGALGVRTWVLLHAEADWRWMEDRDDNPWYPTARLFRQTTPGDWDDVFARVAGELALMAGGSGRSPGRHARST